MAKQRISYVPLEMMDAEMRKEMERCQREGTPRPESSAIRAHVPAAFWFFARSWNDLFRNGVLEQMPELLERSWQLYSQHGILPTSEQGPDPRKRHFNPAAAFVE